MGALFLFDKTNVVSIFRAEAAVVLFSILLDNPRIWTKIIRSIEAKHSVNIATMQKLSSCGDILESYLDAAAKHSPLAAESEAPLITRNA